MGCSHGIPVLLLAVFYLAIFPSHGILHGNLATICYKTPDPFSCQRILGNVPGTISADLPKLSLISINLTKNQADQNLDSFSKLSKNESDPELKKSFKHCVKYYHEIQAHIQKAFKLSRKKIFRDNHPLVTSKKLVKRCNQAIRINSLDIEVMNKRMILSCDISMSVNHYATANAHIQ
ncbi:hypothetical protein SDJN02_08457, partial [Cucurbita argyrosperma subsp. argyrosperma]